jgi:GT2 family glycosyltransferase
MARMHDTAGAPRVFAIVIHYRGLDDTRRCLAALAAAEGAIETILVDNSESGDGRALAAREFAGGARPVRSLGDGRNTGFAEGNNIGIRAALEAGATHVLLVNGDCFVEKDFLAPLLEALAAPDVGIATGKILLPSSPDGRPGEPRRIWAAGSEFREGRAIGLNRGEGALDGPAWNSACDVDYASGCLLLARRDALEKAGLFDERLFLYLEDEDLCRRARRAGFRVRYEPRAVAVHLVHGATGGGPSVEGPATVYYLTRNRVLLARARKGGLGFAAWTAWFLATRALKAARALLSGDARRARWILRAARDGLRGRTGQASPDVFR